MTGSHSVGMVGPGAGRKWICSRTRPLTLSLRTHIAQAEPQPRSGASGAGAAVAGAATAVTEAVAVTARASRRRKRQWWVGWSARIVLLLQSGADHRAGAEVDDEVLGVEVLPGGQRDQQ